MKNSTGGGWGYKGHFLKADPTVKSCKIGTRDNIFFGKVECQGNQCINSTLGDNTLVLGGA